MERTVRSSRAYDGRLISLRVDEVERADGHRATREIVEHPGAVAILAWDGERVALVRQWRHAAGEVLLEIPAGTLEPHEEPEPAARRELAEEMGVTAGSWTRGPSFYTAPGFCTELLTLYLATDITPTSAAAPEDEQVEPAWLPLPEALAAIDDGRITDAKSLVGVMWLARRLGLTG